MDQKMDLLLLGHVGNGTSSVGNIILGRKEFIEQDGSGSAPLSTSVGWADIDGRSVKVVIGPGLLGTDTDEKKLKVQVLDDLSDVALHCPDGFHALLLVLRYDAQLSSDEVKIVEILRTIFGLTFIKDHCVLIFTHGEDFAAQTEQDPGKTFEGWLKKQTGVLGDLIEDCGNQTVLFCNMTNEKRSETLQTLFHCVDEIKRRCNHNLFDDLKEKREKFIKTFGAIQLKEHIQSTINMLNGVLSGVGEKPDITTLHPLLDRLNAAILQENHRPHVVKKLLRGIFLAKHRYSLEAKTIFQEVENEGKDFLLKLKGDVRIVVRQFTQKHQIMNSPQTTQSIDLFLMGKTGHGKSSTGNTILGSEKFKDADTAVSATLDTDSGWAFVDGTLVKVVDGPGLVDTRKDAKGQTIDAENKLSSGFIHCPNGFHALLLVLRYGARFTDEEVKTVDILRSFFGHTFITHHCILIFTHGENFDLQKKKIPQKTFEGWLEEQTDELGTLIKECGNRAVLFYNLTEDKRIETLKALFSYVREIKERYTHELFEKVMTQRKEFIESSGAIQLKKNIQCDISLLIGMLGPDAGEPDKNRLHRLLTRLEEDLGKEDSQLKCVQSLKCGIKQAKEGKYWQANATFFSIETEGRHLLAKLLEAVKRIVASLLQKLEVKFK